MAFSQLIALRLPELGTVDGEIMQAHATLEMRAVWLLVLRRLLGRDGGALQVRDAADQFERGLIIIQHVSPEVQGATGLQHALYVAEKSFVHHSAFAMSLLPPRIGKVDVDRHYRVATNPLPEEAYAISLN